MPFQRYSGTIAELRDQLMASTGVGVSRRTLSRMIRPSVPRMGLGKTTRKKDICIDCQAYDAVMHRRYMHLAHPITTSLSSIMPCFFGEKTGWPSGLDASVPSKWVQFRDMVASHQERHPEMWTLLTEKAQEQLAREQTKAVAMLDQIITELIPISLHWSLRDTLHSELMTNIRHPEEDVLYLLTDWADWCRQSLHVFFDLASYLMPLLAGCFE